jgi:hypothetical protein
MLPDGTMLCVTAMAHRPPAGCTSIVYAALRHVLCNAHVLPVLELQRSACAVRVLLEDSLGPTAPW